MDYHGTELGFGRGNLYINSLPPKTDRGGRPGTDYDSLCTSWPKRLTCDVRPYRPCPITGVVPANLSGQVEPKSPQARSLTAGSDRPVIPLRKMNVLRETVEEFRWPRRGKNKVDADQRAGPRQAAVGRVSEPALYSIGILVLGICCTFVSYFLFKLSCCPTRSRFEHAVCLLQFTSTWLYLTL